MSTATQRITKKDVVDGVPEGWAATTLGELCTYVTSGSRDWSKYYADSGALFFRTQDINQNKLAPLVDIARVTLPERVEGKRTLIAQGDLLITITGANVGKCAHVDSPLPEAYVSQSVALVRLAEGLNGSFLHRQLISRHSGDENTLLQNAAYGVGRPVLNLNNVRQVPILLAPLSEQMRIAAKLDEVLSRIASTRHHLELSGGLLKRFRNAVLTAACSGSLTEDWRKANLSGVPSQSAPEAEGLEGYELPTAWIWAQAGRLYADARYGTSVKCDRQVKNGIPVLRVPNIAAGELAFGDLKYAEFSARELRSLTVEPGDILVCRTNGSLDLIGKAAVMPAVDGTYTFASYLIRLRLQANALLPRYFHIVLSSRMGRNQIEERARTTAGQFNLNLEILRGLVVPLPSVDEQREIVRRVEGLFQVADAIEKRVAAAAARAEKLTDAVLSKAFKGELVPTEAELARAEGREYEPAAALLETVRAKASLGIETGNVPRLPHSRMRR